MASKKGDLGAALVAAARVLDATGTPWMCIGGLTAIAHGVRRTTLELHMCLRGEAEYEALENAEAVTFGAAEVPCARPEDLIIYKLFAGRPKDIQDSETLLLVHRRAIDLSRVRRVLEQLARLSEQPEVLARLDALVGATQPATTQGKTKRRAQRK